MLVRYGAFVEERTNIDRKSFSLNQTDLPIVTKNNRILYFSLRPLLCLYFSLRPLHCLYFSLMPLYCLYFSLMPLHCLYFSLRPLHCLYFSLRPLHCLYFSLRPLRMLVRYGAFVEERTNIDRKSFSLNQTDLPIVTKNNRIQRNGW
jgi:hypothetical protein